MKRCLLLLLSSLLVTSCIREDVSIRPNKRLEVSGRVLPYNSADAIPKIPVATFGILGDQLITTEEHKLGSGLTSAAGDFRFISLDIRNGKFALSVNALSEDMHNQDYATYHFIAPEDDLKTFITLGNIELPQILNFNFSIQNTSDTQEELRYTITYNNTELFYILEDADISLEVPDYYQWNNSSTFGGVHSYTQEAHLYPVETIEGAEIVLTYTLGDEESQELVIPVTSQMSDYVFEY